VKRTGADVYRAQRRGGKGLTGARTDEEDPIEHLFVASTHDWLLVFTTLGKVFSLRVFELPELARDAKGRALVNILEFEPGEKVADCRAVGGFDDPNQFLMLATRSGMVKKTALGQYRRRRTKGLIAVKLREGDELIDAVITKPGDELVLASAKGMAIRFPESDARPMGRDTSGVRGIKLGAGDRLVGMVVADPDATLLTVCEHGYGKRTPFGAGTPVSGEAEPDGEGGEAAAGDGLAGDGPAEDGDGTSGEGGSSGMRYRTQRRGGKGIRDIKTTKRNGAVISIVSVRDDDQVLMMTSRGKIQRVNVAEINTIGRNTQGVRIMRVDEGDTLAAVVPVPPGEHEEADETPEAV